MPKNKNTIIYWIAQLTGWSIFQILLILLSYSAGEIFITKLLIYNCFILFLIYLLMTTGIRFVIIKNHWLKLSIGELVWRSFLVGIVFAFFCEFFNYGVHEIVGQDYRVKPEEHSYTLADFFVGVFFRTLLFSLWQSFYYTYLFVAI